jgi:hypothetical protein
MAAHRAADPAGDDAAALRRAALVGPLSPGDAGVNCGRRVAKLYLPPGSRYFGCRVCRRLTYYRAQTHDKRVDALRKNPELLAAIVMNPGAALDGKSILAMKALS